MQLLSTDNTKEKTMNQDTIGLSVELVPRCTPSFDNPLDESDEMLKMASELKGSDAIRKLVGDLGLPNEIQVNWSFSVCASETCTSDDMPAHVNVHELPEAMEPFRGRILDATIDLVEEALEGKQPSAAVASSLGFKGTRPKFVVETGPTTPAAVSSEELAASMRFQCSAPLAFEYSKGCSSWPW